jgi:hypothetical protein
MSLLLYLVLAQAPAADVPVAIVISSRRDSTTASSVLCEQLKTALGPRAMGEKDSVARLTQLGGVDPHACDGAKLCLQKLAQLLHGVVIGVDVSKAGRLLAGHIEAVSFDRVESLATDDLTGDAKSWPQKSSAAAQAFAQKLSPHLDALKPREEPKPPPQELKASPALEPPHQVVIVPEPPPQPPSEAVGVQAEGPSKGFGPVPYVVTGAAVASVGAGIALLVSGFVDRNTYQGSFQQVPNQMAVASSFSDAQLSSLATASNAKIGLGIAFGVIAAALGVLAGVLFAKE